MNLFETLNIHESPGGEFQRAGNVVSHGVARLYYESGLPLAASATELERHGYSVSWLNVADQFLKQGFGKARIVSEFRELEAFRPGEADIEQIEAFCDAGYEEQREMLWEFWAKQESFAIFNR